MKKNILIVAITFFVTSCDAQTNITNDVFLSKEYVDSVVRGDCEDTESYLKPVEGFTILQDSLYMLTYKGELTFLGKVNMLNKVGDKYQINNFHYYINLKYVSKEEASKYYNAKVFLSFDSGELLLEFYWENKLERYSFVNQFGGYVFTDLFDSQDYLEKKYCRR